MNNLQEYRKTVPDNFSSVIWLLFSNPSIIMGPNEVLAKVLSGSAVSR